MIPEDRQVCECGERRLIFRNSDDLFCIACPADELGEILAWLRCEYPEWVNLKTCPFCGHRVRALIQNLKTGERFCHHCRGSRGREVQ
jgi:hypothetical protein